MTLFEELKSSTKNAHDELEKELDLLSPELTRDDYVDVLKKFYGIYVPVEKLLESIPEWRKTLEGRWKVPLLIDDLKFFGLSEQEISAIPLQQEILYRDSTEDILGTLYVLEGSTLGATILSKHFASRFHLAPLKGLSFFTAYGADTLKNWREWKTLSEDMESHRHLNRATIIGQANKTFSALQNWMCFRIS